jgi:catechol-2,3-dioxygenase
MAAADAANPVLHHVNLKTTRLAEMVEWYGKTVGMRPHHLGAVGAWLSNDGANHRLALLSFPSLQDDPDRILHPGMHHLSFEFASLDELLATYTRLEADGIVPHGCLDHGMTTSMYYLDPDGNSVELQVDNFGDWARSTEFLRTSPEFAANPIGRFFDPDQLVAARATGASAEEIHRSSYAGELSPATAPDLRLPPQSS